MQCSCPEEGSDKLAGITEFEDVSFPDQDSKLPGEGCGGDEDCPPGTLCITLSDGTSYCADVCSHAFDECEGDWVCVTEGEGAGFHVGGDHDGHSHVCVPPDEAGAGDDDEVANCIDCEVDLDCAVSGVHCVDFGVDGSKLCAVPCDVGACPGAATECIDGHCVPVTGQCECYNELDQGLLRDCSVVLDSGLECEGTEVCHGAEGWSECQAVDVDNCEPPCEPVDEICNGLDDDCNDLIDDGLAGVQEICNGQDDDCDGLTDEDVPDGIELCNGIDDDCDGLTDEDVPDGGELCNGIDDDCDGLIDEDVPDGGEECNGIDDDCDGETDEGIEPVVCYEESPFGVCPGVGTCVEGQSVCDAKDPTEEICNGYDDNCDQFTDDGQKFNEVENFNDDDLSHWVTVVGVEPEVVNKWLHLQSVPEHDSLTRNTAGMMDIGELQVVLKAPPGGGAFLTFRINSAEGGWIGWGVYKGEYVLARRGPEPADVQILDSAGQAPNKQLTMRVVLNGTTVTMYSEGQALKAHPDNGAAGYAGLWSVGGTGQFNNFQIIEGCGCKSLCSVKDCGDDGCGGSCGGCPGGFECNPEGLCQCIQQCDGKVCGDDACGGNCGLCPPGSACINDGAQCECQFECGDKQCGNDGCGGTCGVCPEGSECDPFGYCLCDPVCGDKECGDDLCGGTCGECLPGTTCDKNFQCIGCETECDGKQCGDDGCDGQCGVCPAGDVCNNDGQCGCSYLELDVPETDTYGEAAWGDLEIAVDYQPKGANWKEHISLFSGNDKTYNRLLLQYVGGNLQVGWQPIENGNQKGPYNVAQLPIAAGTKLHVVVRAAGGGYAAEVNGQVATAFFGTGFNGQFALTAGDWSNLVAGPLGCDCGPPCKGAQCGACGGSLACTGGACGCTHASADFSGADLSGWQAVAGTAVVADGRLYLAGELSPVGDGAGAVEGSVDYQTVDGEGFTVGLKVGGQQFVVSGDGAGALETYFAGDAKASATYVPGAVLTLAVQAQGVSLIGLLNGKPVAIKVVGEAMSNLSVGLTAGGGSGGFDKYTVRKLQCECGDVCAWSGCPAGCDKPDCQAPDCAGCSPSVWLAAGGNALATADGLLVAGAIVAGATNLSDVEVEATYDPMGAGGWDAGVAVRAINQYNMLVFRVFASGGKVKSAFYSLSGGDWSAATNTVTHEGLSTDAPVTVAVRVQDSGVVALVNGADVNVYAGGLAASGRVGLFDAKGTGRFEDVSVRSLPCTCGDAGECAIEVCTDPECACDSKTFGFDDLTGWTPAGGTGLALQGAGHVAGALSVANWSEVEVTGSYTPVGSDDFKVAVPVRINGKDMVRLNIFRAGGKVKTQWEAINSGKSTTWSTVNHTVADGESLDFWVRVMGTGAASVVDGKIQTAFFSGLKSGGVGLYGASGEGAFDDIVVKHLPCDCSDLCPESGCEAGCPEPGPVDCTPVQHGFADGVPGWQSAGGLATLKDGAMVPTGPVVTAPSDLDDVELTAELTPPSGAYEHAVLVRWQSKKNFLRFHMKKQGGGLQTWWSQNKNGLLSVLGAKQTVAVDPAGPLNVRVRVQGGGAVALVSGASHSVSFSGTAKGRVGFSGLEGAVRVDNVTIRKLPCDCTDPCQGSIGCPTGCAESPCASPTCGCTDLHPALAGGELAAWEPVEGTAVVDDGKLYVGGMVTIGDLNIKDVESSTTFTPDGEEWTLGLAFRVVTSVDFGVFMARRDNKGKLTTWWEFKVGGQLSKTPVVNHGGIGVGAVPIVLRVQGQAAMAVIDDTFADKAFAPGVLNKGRAGVVMRAGGGSFDGLKARGLPCGCEHPCNLGACAQCDDAICDNPDCGCALLEEAVYEGELGSWASAGGTAFEFAGGISPAGALLIGDSAWTDVEVQTEFKTFKNPTFDNAVVLRAADSKNYVRFGFQSTPSGKLETYWQTVTGGTASAKQQKTVTGIDSADKLTITARAIGDDYSATVNETDIAPFNAAAGATGQAGIAGFEGDGVFTKFVVIKPCCIQPCN